jgi:hypothetical protein
MRPLEKFTLDDEADGYLENNLNMNALLYNYLSEDERYIFMYFSTKSEKESYFQEEYNKFVKNKPELVLGIKKCLREQLVDLLFILSNRKYIEASKEKIIPVMRALKDDLGF